MKTIDRSGVEKVRDFARRQAENPYNHSRAEKHVRVLFKEIADALDELLPRKAGKNVRVAS